MRPTLAPIALSLAAACASAEPDEPSDWVVLFDGSSTEAFRGFRRASMPEGWVVEDGALARVGPGGDLVTRERYGDFVLELEWRISPGGNSGILFRVDEEHEHAWESGPEMQVLDDAALRDGLDPRTSAGANYALHAPEVDATRPAGEWNRVRLEARGARVRHVLNGETVVEYELWTPDWEERVAASKFASMPAYGRNRRGHVALQDHGDAVWYRDVRILPLD